MPILIAVLSIFAIAGFVRFLGKISSLKICPVCAGVAGTWLWMLLGVLSGYLPTYLLPTAILMGGSVVGIAYQLEKILPQTRSPILWKLLFIPAGFAAAYYVIEQKQIAFLASLIMLVLVVLFFKKTDSMKTAINASVENLKEKMKNCC